MGLSLKPNEKSKLTSLNNWHTFAISHSSVFIIISFKYQNYKIFISSWKIQIPVTHGNSCDIDPLLHVTNYKHSEDKLSHY